MSRTRTVLCWACGEVAPDHTTATCPRRQLPGESDAAHARRLRTVGGGAVGVMRAPEVHSLKIAPEPFEAVKRDLKTAEYRRDDREPRFEVGDVLLLREWTEDEGYTGRRTMRVVTHVARGPFIPDGYAMLSLRREVVA